RVSVLLRPASPPILASFPTRRSSDLAGAQHRPEHQVGQQQRRQRDQQRELARSEVRATEQRDRLHGGEVRRMRQQPRERGGGDQDRKSTRLNSSHVKNSYAVFCLKKK